MTRTQLEPRDRFLIFRVKYRKSVHSSHTFAQLVHIIVKRAHKQQRAQRCEMRVMCVRAHMRERYVTAAAVTYVRSTYRICAYHIRALATRRQAVEFHPSYTCSYARAHVIHVRVYVTRASARAFCATLRYLLQPTRSASPALSIFSSAEKERERGERERERERKFVVAFARHLHLTICSRSDRYRVKSKERTI